MTTHQDPQPQTLLRDEQLSHPSRASIGGHPIHPMLIPFPIAFLTGTLITDCVYWARQTEFWAHCSRWLLIAGIVGALVAAVFGLIDFLGLRKPRRLLAGWYHAATAVAAVAFSVVNLIIRWNDPVEGVLPIGLVLSAIVVVILLFAGWFGGHLVYVHRIGVRPGLGGE